MTLLFLSIQYCVILCEHNTLITLVAIAIISHMNETNVVATCSHRLGSCQRRPRRVAGPSDQTRPHEWRFYMNEFARWSSGEIWVARYLWTTVRCHDLSRSMTSVTNDLFAFASQMHLLTTVGSEKIGTQGSFSPKGQMSFERNLLLAEIFKLGNQSIELHSAMHLHPFQPIAVNHRSQW